MLKSIQKRSSKKVLEQKLNLQTTKTVSTTKVKKIGCIVDLDELAEDKINALKKAFTFVDDFVLIGYQQKKNEQAKADFYVFDDKAFGWKGSIKDVTVAEFCKQPFDVLISYFTSEKLPLQLAATLSVCDLKIGVEGSDQRIHDLIIHSPIHEISVFKDELIKYLTILNKI